MRELSCNWRRSGNDPVFFFSKMIRHLSSAGAWIFFFCKRCKHNLFWCHAECQDNAKISIIRQDIIFLLVKCKSCPCLGCLLSLTGHDEWNLSRSVQEPCSLINLSGPCHRSGSVSSSLIRQPRCC